MHGFNYFSPYLIYANLLRAVYNIPLKHLSISFLFLIRTIPKNKSNQGMTLVCRDFLLPFIFSFENNTMYTWSKIAYQLTTDNKKILQFSFVPANIFRSSMDSIRRDKKKSNLQTFYLSTIMFICHTVLNNIQRTPLNFFFILRR